MAYGSFTPLVHLDGGALDDLNDMLRYLFDSMQRHMRLDNAGIDVDTPSLILTTDGGQSRVLELDAAAQRAAFSSLYASELFVPADGNALMTCGAPTLCVGQNRTPDGTTQFTSFASAVASLGKVLAPGTTTITVDAGTYHEGLVVEGFTGRGTLLIELAGGVSSERAVFTAPSSIAHNRTTVQVRAATVQANCPWKPVLRGDSGTALTIAHNAGAVLLSGVHCRGGADANTVEATYNAHATLHTCTLDNTPANRFALNCYYLNLCLFHARGSNAGTGLRMSDGAHVLRRGTTLAGAPALLNFGGATHDIGAIAVTDSAAVSDLGTTPQTQSFPAQTRTWRTPWQQYRSDTGLWQGKLGDESHIGCLFFPGAAALAGRTVLSAKLRLKRLPGAGDARPVPVCLSGLSAPTAMPFPGAAAPAPQMQGGPGGCKIAELHWSGGGTFDIPVVFAQQVIAGQGLALVGDDYARFAGAGDEDGIGIEVVYL